MEHKYARSFGIYSYIWIVWWFLCFSNFEKNLGFFRFTFLTISHVTRLLCLSLFSYALSVWHFMLRKYFDGIRRALFTLSFTKRVTALCSPLTSAKLGRSDRTEYRHNWGTVRLVRFSERLAPFVKRIAETTKRKKSDCRRQ